MTTASRVVEVLKTDTSYTFNIRAKNSMGKWGPQSDNVSITTQKDTTAPAVLSSITLLLLAGVFNLKWAKPSTLDLRGGGFKIYVYTSDTSASAVLIREVGYTSDSTQIIVGEKSQDASITITAGTTYYFWVTTLDDSGNESAKVATTPTSGAVSAADLTTVPSILSKTTGIDAKVVATTNLYTVPAGKTTIVTSAVIRVTAADTITVAPTLGIGIAAGEDDIIASTLLTGLDAVTKLWRFDVEGIAVIGAAAEIIKLGIDVGATATTMTISIDLIGYLL